jgi:uncharacterized protein YgiM (DUF1202 family)
MRQASPLTHFRQKIDRRAILRATGAFAAMAVAGGAATRATSAQTVGTLANEWVQPDGVGGESPDGSLGFKADFPFYAIAPHWPGDLAFPASVEVSLSADGQHYTKPQTLGASELDAGPPDRDGRTYGSLLVSDQAQYVKYRGLDSNGNTAAIPGLAFTYIDASGGPTTDDVSQAALDPSVARPPIISRSEWGSNLAYGGTEKASTLWPPQYQTVEHIIIHHSETPNFRDPLLEIRSIHYYHAITRGWGDIGYNYLVDFMGNVYEGRAGGENVIGGHAYQYAYGSAGICCMGSFSVENATPEALAGLIWITAWAGRNLDPLGKADFHETAQCPTICGHRDVVDSSCPGDELYGDLDHIRHAVSDVLAGTTNPAPDPAFKANDVVAITVDDANLRGGPGTQFDIAVTLPVGTIMAVIEGPATDGDYVWYKLEGDPGSGWAATSVFTASDAPPPGGTYAAGDTVYVNTDDLNLRQQPDLASLIVTVVSAGTEATVLDGPMRGDSMHWYKLQTSAGTGWAVEKYLSAKPVKVDPTFTIGDTVQVDTDKLNLRGDASTGSWVVATVPTKTRGSVLDGPIAAEGHTWVQLQTALGTGWCVTGYLKAAKPLPPPPVKFQIGAKVKVDTDLLNLREHIDPTTAVVAQLPEGMVCTVTDGPLNGDGHVWYELDTPKGKGYADQTYLALASADNGT